MGRLGWSWALLVVELGCGSQVYLDPPDSGAGPPDSGTTQPGDVGSGDGGADAGPDATVDAGPTTHSVSVLRVGCGASSGRIESDPAGLMCAAECTGDFTEGTEVTLSAFGTPAMPFTGWSGDCSGEGPCTVTADRPRAVSARFSDLRWARALGGEREGTYGHVRALAADPAEAAYLGGYWSAGAGFDFGVPPVGCDPTQGQPLFLTKLSTTDGVARWSRCMGSSNAYAYGELTGLAVVDRLDVVATGFIDYQPHREADPPGHVDLGSGPIFCLREGDQPNPRGRVLFLARYRGSDGSLQWERHDCLDAGSVHRVVSTPAGLVGLYNYTGINEVVTVAGSTVGGTLSGYSMVAVKYAAADGTPEWVRAFGHDDTSPYGNLWIGDLAADGTHFYVTGALQGTANFGGGPVSMTSDAQDMFLAKYRLADGGLEWVRVSQVPRPDGMSYVNMSRMIQAQNGDLLVTGQVWGTVDLGLGPVAYPPTGTLFLARYASVDGAALWVKEVGCTEPFHIPDLDEEADGDLLVGGAGCAQVDSVDHGLSALRFDPQGNLQSTRTLTSTSGNMGVEQLEVDSAGRWIFGATLGGSATYCDDHFYTAGFDGLVYGAFLPEE